MHTPPLSIVLELTRVDDPDDPHAFRFEPQGYTLRGPGGGVERFAIPWGRELLADVDSLRQPNRDPAAIQRVGNVLQRALGPIGWKGLGDQICAASEAGRPVVVTLRSNAAELYALPWELIGVGASGRHLGELPGVLLRQEWPGTTTTAESPSPRPEGGRVLLGWSAAGGAVPAMEHRRAIASAWSEGHMGFDPATDVLPYASAAGLAAALARAEAEGRPFAILHLLAHGGRAGSTFGVVLDGEDGTPCVVDAGRLRLLLAPHARSLRLVVLAACDGGNAGEIGNHLGSVAQALHRAGIRAVLASRYPLSVAGSIALAETLYRALLVDLFPLERAFTATRARLARSTEHLDWASLQLYARAADGDDTRPVVFCPYRGLLAFEPRHRRFFFGRDAEVEETLADMQALIDGARPRFLIVVGASGTGKSSLVLAGVVPEAARLVPRPGGPWEVLKMMPGAAPVAALAGLLVMRSDPKRPLLLVVDQFEEVFTHTVDPAARVAFVRELWALSRADTGVHVILTLRVDFLGHCGDLVVDDHGLSLDRVAYDEAHRVFVARIDPAQVRSAIEAPAALVGLTFAPGLLDRILADVGAEPGVLPLLQYALRRVWERRLGHTLAAEVYEAIGGLVGALEKDADDLLASLDAEERRYARRILTQLVGISEDEAVDTRRRVEIARLGPVDGARRPVFDAVVGRLVDARLLVQSEKGGAATFEIAHEALIRHWETLRGWMAEDRVKLTELETIKTWVRAWQAHGTLLSGAQLGYAGDIVRRHGDDVDAAMRQLVQASEGQRRRQRNTVRAVITTLMIGVLGLAGISAYAFEQKAAADAERTRANTNEGEARENEKLAKTNAGKALAGNVRLAGDAWNAGRADHTFLYLLEAELGGRSDEPSRRLLGAAAALSVDVEVLRCAPGPVSFAALDPAGARAVMATAGEGWLCDTRTGERIATLGGVGNGAFSDDGNHFAGVGGVNNLRLWSSRDGRPLAERASVHSDSVMSLQFSHDGQQLVTASWDQTARLWVTPTLEPSRVLEDRASRMNADPWQEHKIPQTGPRNQVWRAVFTPDARGILVTDGDGLVWSWTPRTGARRKIHEFTGWARTVVFSPSGDHLVIGAENGRAILSAADGTGARSLEHDHGEVHLARFSPDESLLLTFDQDRAANLWRVQDGKLLARLTGHTGWLEDAVFSADSRRVVTTSDDGTARLWDARRSTLLAVLSGHGQGVGPARFSADNQQVMTASKDGTIRRWDLARVLPRGRRVSAEGEHVLAASYSTDGLRVVSARADQAAHLRIVGEGPPGEGVRLGDLSAGSSARFSTDGELLLSDRGSEVAVLSARTGQADRSIPVASGDPGFFPGFLGGHRTVFSGNGPVVAVASGQSVQMWERATGTSKLLDVRQSPDVLALSPDGTRLVTADRDGNASLWRLPGGERLASLGGHRGDIWGIRFSRDGMLFITASADRTARLWRGDDGRATGVVLAHDGEVLAAAFNADASLVVTGSTDHTARLWSVRSGTPLGPMLDVHEGDVVHAEFSPDGREVVTVDDPTGARSTNVGEERNAARVWTLPPFETRPQEELVRRARCLPIRLEEGVFLPTEPDPAACAGPSSARGPHEETGDRSELLANARDSTAAASL